MKFVITMKLMLGSALVFGQQITKYSMDNGGSVNTVGAIQIVYSLGEVFVSEHNGTINVSQGFINPQSQDVLSVDSEFVKSKIITIYPNPTIETIFIQNIKSPMPYIITDNLGKEIKKGIIHPEISTVEVNNLSVGLYFLIIDKGKEKEILKFIKK